MNCAFHGGPVTTVPPHLEEALHSFNSGMSRPTQKQHHNETQDKISETETSGIPLEPTKGMVYIEATTHRPQQQPYIQQQQSNQRKSRPPQPPDQQLK